MTKEEVLQGALELNDSDKNHTITVDSDKIIIDTKYYSTPLRRATFRYIAHLKDDNTYTETCFDNDGFRTQYGNFGKKQKSVSFTLGSINDNTEIEKEKFNSDDTKKILRDYLESCGYKRKNKNLLKLALCIAIPVVVVALILVAVIISSTTKFVDTNGPDNFALTEITRDDILSKNNNYRSFMVSEKHSGYHTNFVGHRFRDQDYDNISKSFGKIHGIVILQATKIWGNTLTLNINSSVESGNAEIVIIIDGEYYCSVDINQDQSITLQDISNKEVIVKLAGEGAKMKIDVTRVY